MSDPNATQPIYDGLAGLRESTSPETTRTPGETPRTDGRIRYYDFDGCNGPDKAECVSADFARTLERELDEAHEKNRQMAADVTKAVYTELNNVALKQRAEAAESALRDAQADAERYLDAIFKIADDGWLVHGVEGMDDTQEAIYKIAQEHPTYKERAALAARKEGQ